MTRYAILLGSAPDAFRQKKIEEMFYFLDSKRTVGDSIVTFANGISEIMLEMILDNSVKQLAEAGVEPVETTKLQARHCDSEQSEAEAILENSEQNARHPELDSGSSNKVVSMNSTTANDKKNSIFLYICTLQPVGESEKAIWLGGEEIRRDVILHYQELATECGIDMQVIFDSDSEVMSDEELGWEKVIEPVEITKQENLRLSAESAGNFFGGER